MTTARRHLLVIGPPEPWVPPEGHRVGRWTLAVRHVPSLEAAQGLPDAPGWDVVAFRTDALPPVGPSRTLEALRALAPEATFLPVTLRPDPRDALLFLKNGAYEYLEEPLEPAEFDRALAEALENQEAFREILELNRTLEAQAEQLRREKAELERRNRELEAVSLLTRDLASSLEPDQVLERLGGRLRESFPGRRTRVGLLERGRRRVRVLSPCEAGGGGADAASVAHLDPADWSAWARSFMRGGREIVGWPGGEPGPALARLHRNPFVVVPMAARGKPVGFLCLESPSPDRPVPEDEVSLLRIFADTAAIALDNARLYYTMRELSVRDELTGLYNRRYFLERLAAEWNHATRHGMPLSILMLDIDHFKLLNDGNDHLTGDAALRRLASTLLRNTRGIDTVARYGGEEFVILLPRTDAAGARVAAEKLRRVVGRTRFPGEHAVPGAKLTVSVGVASHPGTARTAEELLERADRALYRAKQEGRNRTYAWEERSGTAASV